MNAYILAQPQISYALDKPSFDSARVLFVDVKYQQWVNKLGDDKNDNVLQALVVMRFKDDTK